jgi:hypothetical protein
MYGQEYTQTDQRRRAVTLTGDWFEVRIVTAYVVVDAAATENVPVTRPDSTNPTTEETRRSPWATSRSTRRSTARSSRRPVGWTFSSPRTPPSRRQRPPGSRRARAEIARRRSREVAEVEHVFTRSRSRACSRT